ncbi:ADP-ribosyltransferase [Streptomyces sp. NPDC059897]|uniref:ADP-ribosyltransferase n=1 Tax=Streptomyces sp. NPDC059897 TaxID=3346994 RepID=UPI003647C66C
MINKLPRTARRLAALPAAAVSVLALASAPSATASAPDSATAKPAASMAKAAPSCPVVPDRLYAAVNRVPLERISPEPEYRDDCQTLYRADGRAPAVIFKEGFAPKDTVNGQYDLEQYVLKNQPSPFVSTTRDHDLFKKWTKWMKGGAYNYYIDAPNGIDVNETIGDTHKYADQVEVAFPGGVSSRFVIGACPINKETNTERMSECVSNPGFRPATAAPAAQ